MRIVPRNPTLNSAVRKCFTKRGRSVDPFCGSHSTAWPLRPAIEVKVPHSCAVRLGFEVPCRAAWPETVEAESKRHANNGISRSERTVVVAMPGEPPDGIAIVYLNSTSVSTPGASERFDGGNTFCAVAGAGDETLVASTPVGAGHW